MSIEIGNKIGEGGCSEVFEWGNESKIVKLAKPNTNTAALQAELHHCRTAWECGLPVPRPYELVNIEGRSGIVFERNPNNILLKDNDAVMIDWNNASTGNPEADLAEYIIMIRYAILPTHLSSEANIGLNATREASIHMFMEEYERLTGIGYTDIEPWIAPIAARKLSADGISEEEKYLLVSEIRRRLIMMS